MTYVGTFVVAVAGVNLLTDMEVLKVWPEMNAGSEFRNPSIAYTCLHTTNYSLGWSG